MRAFLDAVQTDIIDTAPGWVQCFSRNGGWSTFGLPECKRQQRCEYWQPIRAQRNVRVDRLISERVRHCASNQFWTVAIMSAH